MSMTLEQVRNILDEWGCSSLSQVQMATELLRRLRDSIDAHLSRQSEVSDEDVRHLEWVRDITSDSNMVLTKAELARVHRYASAALTAVWHNWPAQDGLCERNPAPDASVPLVPSSPTVVLDGPVQEACPFCGKGGMHPLGETCLNNTPSFDLADAAQEKAYRLVGYTSQQVVDQAINGGGVSEASIQPKPFAMASARLYTDTDTWGDPLKADDDQAQEKAEPVAWAWSCDGMTGWALGHLKPTPENTHKFHERNTVVRPLIFGDTAPPAERVRVPDGWKLAPIEPTPDMILAGIRANLEYAGKGVFGSIYKAMLSAAPEADHG